jgi:hypothetical protein
MSDELTEQFMGLAADVMEEMKDIRSSLVRIDCALRCEGDEPLLYALPEIATGIKAVANAITPIGAAPGQDAGGGYVGSLTEAVMGVSGGLFAIAGAIDRLAAAIQPQGERQ